MSKFGIGKDLGNTQTSSSKGSTPPGGGTTASMARGARMDPPAGAAQFPGKGLSGTQTKNSLTPKR